LTTWERRVAQSRNEIKSKSQNFMNEYLKPGVIWPYEGLISEGAVRGIRLRVNGSLTVSEYNFGTTTGKKKMETQQVEKGKKVIGAGSTIPRKSTEGRGNTESK